MVNAGGVTGCTVVVISGAICGASGFCSIVGEGIGAVVPSIASRSKVFGVCVSIVVAACIGLIASGANPPALACHCKSSIIFISFSKEFFSGSIFSDDVRGFSQMISDDALISVTCSVRGVTGSAAGVTGSTTGVTGATGSTTGSITGVTGSTTGATGSTTGAVFSFAVSFFSSSTLSRSSFFGASGKLRSKSKFTSGEAGISHVEACISVFGVFSSRLICKSLGEGTTGVVVPTGVVGAVVSVILTSKGIKTLKRSSTQTTSLSRLFVWSLRRYMVIIV